MDVGLITCRVLPEPDPDQELLLAHLRAAGLEPALVPWDAPPWDRESLAGLPPVCILRSCWNYPEHPEAFEGWLRAAALRTRLINPPTVATWNLHKQYLQDLERVGVPTVPTVFLDRGSRASLQDLVDVWSWDDVVAKPSISAGSFRTRRFAAGEVRSREAEAWFDELLAERDVMVQPYLASVEEHGERALVWIDGEFTHAIHKRPRFVGEDEQVDLAEASVEELDFGARVLAAYRDLFDEPLLYGRVDILRDGEGRMLLSEFELLEPSLFLLQSSAALERFVGGIHRLARGPHGGEDSEDRRAASEYRPPTP